MSHEEDKPTGREHAVRQLFDYTLVVTVFYFADKKKGTERQKSFVFIHRF